MTPPTIIERNVKPRPKLILSSREKLMRKRYTKVVKSRWRDHWWAIYLKIGVQSFLIGEFGALSDARWFQDRLAVALARIEL